MQTCDNHDVQAGDIVWVWAGALRKFLQHTIKVATEHKIEYTETCEHTGYLGARYDIVYKNKPLTAHVPTK